MDDTATRLADWLDRLGLTDQLGAAGLPTFTRDDDGRAVWTDPGTGVPLSPDQLADLDRLLHQDGEEQAHAVPVELVKLRRLAQVRERLLDQEVLDYDALARRRGTSLNAARFAVHKARDQHALLVVTDDARVVVPAFQLTPDGEVRPELEPVLGPLLAAGTDPWRVWGWLTEPAALLGGLVPQEAAADPELADVVRRAAEALAERARA